MKNRKRGHFWTSTDMGEICIFLYYLFTCACLMHAQVYSSDGIDVEVVLSFHTDNLL